MLRKLLFVWACGLSTSLFVAPEAKAQCGYGGAGYGGYGSCSRPYYGGAYGRAYYEAYPGDFDGCGYSGRRYGDYDGGYRSYCDGGYRGYYDGGYRRYSGGYRYGRSGCR